MQMLAVFVVTPVHGGTPWPRDSSLLGVPIAHREVAPGILQLHNLDLFALFGYLGIWNPNGGTHPALEKGSTSIGWELPHLETNR